MLRSTVAKPEQVTDYSYTRIVYDVSSGKVATSDELPVLDDMDFLGGIGRTFKITSEYEVEDPFAPESPLVINTGCMTGTEFMTGLRTYFAGYSPLKRTLEGKPMPAWSAMSGCFGRKFAATGIGDLILTGAASEPSILVISQTENGPAIALEKASPEMIGTRTPERIGYLNQRFNEGNRKIPAHFAVIGPAGEQWQTVWYACIVGSTQEGLQSGEDKFRYAGRLGMGSVLGSKNIAGLVVVAPDDKARKGDERMKAINREIGKGDQSRSFRNPLNGDGLGGSGKNAKLLDDAGILPVKNFAPDGENLATVVHLETMRDENPSYVVVDKGCFGCQIACHQDFYAAPEGGKDPDPRKARRDHGPYLGRYEFEPMELSGPNLGNLDPDENLKLARLDDDLGFDTISINVTVSFVMDYNSRGGDQIAGGLQFGDVEGAAKLKEDIAYGREKLLGKGVKAASEEIGGAGFAMHCKGVEHSAYLGQTNPGYPFATAGGHMSMRTFLLYVMDPKCKPESADYWVEQITTQGWAWISKDLYGGCLFALSPPAQVAEGIESIFGVPFTAERLLDATYRAHVLGFALERRQGTSLDDYGMPEELYKGERKGDLPGVNFLSRELMDEIRTRVFDHLNSDIAKLGYGELIDVA